ncbi:MAG: glycosyl hydrolase [Bacteroidota bacterium]
MNAIKNYLVISIVVVITGCVPEFNSIEFQRELNVKLVDTSASKETVLLFHNLKKLSEEKIIFGHQDATAYGVGWSGDSNRSDIKDVINSYPGLYGWDFSFLNRQKNVDTQKYFMAALVKESFARGGVNTFSWHYNNPATDSSFYDTTIVVNKILPGGGYYLKYLSALDTIAGYSKTLVDSEGNLIPIIFRPYHEFDGNWFWWGKPFCSKDEFIELWKTTVDYLKNKKRVKNFIYAFSSDRKFKTEKEFLERYPGDEYVDILGMDNYYDFTPDGNGLEWVKKKLKIISDVALKKNKIAAFTETGLDTIPDPLWWTDKLFKVVDDDSIKIAYIMVWRNANGEHHFAPYKGHASAEDFVKFGLHPKILFENQLPDLYTKPLNDDTIRSIDKRKKIELIKILGSVLWLQ